LLHCVLLLLLLHRIDLLCLHLVALLGLLQPAEKRVAHAAAATAAARITRRCSTAKDATLDARLALP
jgi:hypothetical protein